MRCHARGSAARAGLALVVTVAAACGAGTEPPVRVTVPPGATMRTAAESLARAGVVGSARMFRTYAKARRADRGIKAGTYLIAPDASWGTILTSLRSGKGVVEIVTIPEGFRIARMESLFVAKLNIPAESLRAAAADSGLRARLGVPVETVEGYLFPDTYYVPPGTNARAVVQMMTRRFEQKWKPEWTARLDTLGVTRHDVMTLASIVEGEARKAEERPVIAAVYWNRLKKKMLLQADPTVQYALPQYQKRLLNRHLTVESRYNTYRYPGLPPGPIAAPGAASIQATLYPANVPYLYFVAFPDGHHEFRVTLEEHNAIVRVARRAWSSVRAAGAAAASPAASKRPAAAP